MFFGDEVADQIDAERPFCQCLRLSDEIPPASQTAAARAGRAIIAMPAFTIGVVSPKVRVMDVENMIWIL